MDGIANEYFDDGMFRAIRVYENGKLVRKSTFNKEGTIVSE
jgi:hypothetical protein